MTAILDHIHMGCANVYTTAFDLTKTTRIGHYDGGFVSNVTIGQKAVPLGGKGVYIEIESIVDPFATADVTRRPWWYKRAVALGSPIFSGVCLRVNTMEELGEIAKRHGGTIRPKLGIRTRPDGPEVRFWEAPYVPGVPVMNDPWETGKPNWCCWEDRLYVHPSGQPVINTPGLLQPMGVAWMEMGGNKARMQQWLGQNPDDLNMKFNGKSLGLYAIGVSTDMGEVEIRRPSATGV
ncbi:MAG TPA: VOC family protein [Vicinamibacterales bacterium]|nr:VOC family protein [Vicinamibacterales bacterium]